MERTRASTRETIADWPEERRALAAALGEKYGEPDEATPTRLRWIHNHPWKRTTLHRDGVQHDFPLPHLDVLEQTIDYRVPLDKVADLLRYDGSLTIRRTAGELSAFCSNEAVNTLSINLADEIVTGRTDVAGARKQYCDDIAALAREEKPALTQGFTFSVMRGGTAEPDAAVL